MQDMHVGNIYIYIKQQVNQQGLYTCKHIYIHTTYISVYVGTYVRVCSYSACVCTSSGVHPKILGLSCHWQRCTTHWHASRLAARQNRGARPPSKCTPRDLEVNGFNTEALEIAKFMLRYV